MIPAQQMYEYPVHIGAGGHMKMDLSVLASAAHILKLEQYRED